MVEGIDKAITLIQDIAWAREPLPRGCCMLLDQRRPCRVIPGGQRSGCPYKANIPSLTWKTHPCLPVLLRRGLSLDGMRLTVRDPSCTIPVILISHITKTHPGRKRLSWTVQPHLGDFEVYLVRSHCPVRFYTEKITVPKSGKFSEY